jgi:hypothetical protein
MGHILFKKLLYTCANLAPGRTLSLTGVRAFSV